MPRPLFRDPVLQEAFDRVGYVTFPALGPETVREVREYCDAMELVDGLGAGYKVGLYQADFERKRRCREFLHATAFPFLEPFFADRWPYVCSYLVKEPGGAVIPAHQDWSYCDETVYDPATCWIPLCDVDEDNAALGFIDGSHKYFDYLRMFPYMVVETPVLVHAMQLMPFVNLLRLKAGEAVVFNNKTIHGSFSNYTNKGRPAVAFLLQPANEALLSYYLKPNGACDTLLKYAATPDFYLEYNQPTLWEMYKHGKVIQGHEYEEVPYRFDRIGWPELEEKVIAGGHQKDPWKVAKIEEFFHVKL